MRPRTGWWLKGVIALALAAVAAALVLRYGWPWSRWTPEAIQSQVAAWGAWGPAAYILGYTLRVVCLIPASVYTIAGIVLFGSWRGALLIFVGAMLCGLLEFGLARWLGRAAVERWLARTHARVVLQVDHHVAQHGLRTVFFIRLIPNVPYDLQNLSLGLSPVRWGPYLAGTVLGMLPWCLAYGLLGNALQDTRNISKVLFGLLALILLIWGPWLWRRRRRLS